MNTLAFEYETANGSMPIEKMPDRWLYERLMEGLRAGRVGKKGDSDWNQTMAFIGAVNREASGKGKGPSSRVRGIARQIYRGFRYSKSDEPGALIDDDDSPADDERQAMWAEF